jgi:hypothetical protein
MVRQECLTYLLDSPIPVLLMRVRQVFAKM